MCTNADNKRNSEQLSEQIYVMKNAPLPIPVKRALRKLGENIRDARRRRRIPTTLMAERASISRTTLNKVEKGDPSVSLGNYSAVLFVLGMAERLGNLADPAEDETGRRLEEERLPKRIHLKSKAHKKP